MCILVGIGNLNYISEGLWSDQGINSGLYNHNYPSVHILSNSMPIYLGYMKEGHFKQEFEEEKPLEAGKNCDQFVHLTNLIKLITI